MPVLLVSCDTRKDEERRRRLADTLKEYGDAFALCDSTYLISTNRSCDDVLDGLSKKIPGTNDDSLFVLTVPQSYTGRLPPKVKEWFQLVRRKMFYGYDPSGSL